MTGHALPAPTYSLAALRGDLGADILACTRGASAFQSARISNLRKLSVLLTPSFLCSLLCRLSHWCWCKRMYAVARLFAGLNRIILRADIHPASRIGGGFYIPHTVGVIFEGHAGARLSLLAFSAVSEGQRHPLAWRGEPTAPVLGDDVSVGTYAVIHGAVRVGNRVRISQGTVVLRDIPDDSVVIGASRTRLLRAQPDMTMGEAS